MHRPQWPEEHIEALRLTHEEENTCYSINAEASAQKREEKTSDVKLSEAAEEAENQMTQKRRG